MKPEQRIGVNAAIVKTIERVTAMLAEPMDIMEMSQMTLPMGTWLKASIEFKGPLTGTLIAVFPSSLAAEIAANMPGAERTSESTAARGAVDLLHTLCGEVLAALAGKESFELDASQPSPVTLDEVGRLCSGDSDSFAYSLDGMPLVMRLAAAAAGD